jgi:hypothetical protein
MLPSFVGRIGSLSGFAALQVSTVHSLAAAHCDIQGMTTPQLPMRDGARDADG